MPPTYSISSESTTSGSTSSTIWGPGTLTGKALVAFGNATLKAVESAVIHRRLRIIASYLSQSKDEVSDRSERVYEDLLELCRRDLYSSSVRLQALSMVMVQIASMRTSNLVKALIKWPSVEVSVFLSEIIKCIPFALPGPSHDSREVMHTKLEKLYISSLARETNSKADPFMIFIGQLATTGEIGCEAIAESRLIDKILSMFLDDSRNIQTSYRWLGSDNSTQLLGISILGCVDLHENITVAHDASDPEARRLLENSRKSLIGSESHLAIVPFITRTGVTLQTQSGTSNGIQVTINDIPASSNRCRFVGSKSSLVWADHAANHACLACDHSSTRNIRDPSMNASASPHREASQGTGNKLRLLKRAFSVGGRQQAGKPHVISTHPAPSQSLNVPSSSRFSGAEVTRIHPNNAPCSHRNSQLASLSSSRTSAHETCSSRNQRRRLRRTVSDGCLQMSSCVNDHDRFPTEPCPREGDGFHCVKRSYSVGPPRLDGHVNTSSISTRSPIANSSSWQASTSSEIGRVNEDHHSSTEDYQPSSDSSEVYGRGLEQRTRSLPRPLPVIQTNSASIPDSTCIQDRLCCSPQSEVLVRSPRLSIRGNRLQRLKRAFSLNDRQQSKRTDHIAASPALPARVSVSQSQCDVGAIEASQDPSHHTPRVEDEILANLPASSNLAANFTVRGLRHLKRAFSTGDRQQEQPSTAKALQRLRRAFSTGDRCTDRIDHLITPGESSNLSDPPETPSSPPLLSPADLLPPQQSRPPPSTIHLPTADQSLLPDTENEKSALAQATSPPLITPSINLPSYPLQPISDPSPANGGDDIPPPYLCPFQEQLEGASPQTASEDHINAKGCILQSTSKQPLSTSSQPEPTQNDLPPPYRGISSSPDADTVLPNECVASGCVSQPAAFGHMILPSYDLQPPLVVFLQHRGIVKRVSIEARMSLSLLRDLFMDRFSLDFALENFPAIYIHDPRSGVKYELENVNDLEENSLISLDLNPLDEIKQHIDAQILILSQDLKNLRSVMAVDRGQPSSGTPSSPSGALARRPVVARRTRALTRRVSTLINDLTVSLTQPLPS